ncbi:hypothetical protein GCM10023323_05690 [Streptomyces thinghirensis]|uniref:Uncharacterized protein n=1 Tax=Streptomyces thinghirensis TaxID=551547 RepID=A0ABP9SXM5_9ACTN
MRISLRVRRFRALCNEKHTGRKRRISAYGRFSARGRVPRVPFRPGDSAAVRVVASLSPSKGRRAKLCRLPPSPLTRPARPPRPRHAPPAHPPSPTPRSSGVP